MSSRAENFALLLALTFATQSFAQADDELGEAVPLEAAPAPPSVTPDAPSTLAWRAYGLFEAHYEKLPPRQELERSVPNLEAGGTLNWKPRAQVSVFAEGRARYTRADEGRHGFFDQGGLRVNPGENLTLAVGKERNRRAPGLIVSPSDFLHSSQALPGLREERAGVWLGRASYQSESLTTDLIYLEEGAYAARGFLRTHGVDLALDAGRVQERGRIGASVQTFAAKVWRIYAETGAAEDTRPSQLFGGGYEGFDKLGLRAEYYRNGAPRGVAKAPTLLPDRDYAIASVSLLELADSFSCTETLVKSLNHEDLAAITRAELLVSDRNVAGLTYIRLTDEAWQATLDWKISF